MVTTQLSHRSALRRTALRRTALRRTVLALLTALLAVAGLVPATLAHAATTPITPGTPFRVQLSQDPGPSEASYTFAGSAGQRVTLSQTGSVGSSGVLYQLSAPGQLLAPQTVGSWGELGVLPASGTWTLNAREINGTSADLQVTLGLVRDTTTSLALGTQITRTLATPGVNHLYTFAGTTGQKVVVTVPALTARSAFNPGVRVQLIRPDGTALGTASPLEGPAVVSGVLDASGTWTLQIDPVYDTTGSITFTVTRPAAQVITVTPGATTNLTHSGGKDILLRFTAQAGQRVTYQVAAADLQSRFGGTQTPAVSGALLRPDGTFFEAIGATAPGFYESTETLPVAGTWTMQLRPVSDTIRTQTVKLGLVSDVSATATLGQALPIRIATPGQNAVVRFTASAGTTLTAGLDNSSWTAGSAGGEPPTPGAYARLYTPDGNLDQILLFPGSGYAERSSLPVTGTYTLVLDPDQDSVGNASLTLRTPAVTTTRLTLGTATTATFQRGDTVRYTFAGVPGRRGYLDLTRAGWRSEPFSSSLTIRLLRPDGTTFRTWGNVDVPRWLESEALDARGTWTLELDPDGGSYGSVTFTANQITDQTANLTIGRQVTARIAAPGQQVVFSFRGTQGTRLAIDTLRSAWTNPADPSSASNSAVLITPSGVQETNFGPGTPYPTSTSETRWADTDFRLNETGTWRLVIDVPGATTGSTTFTLRALQDLTGGAITVGTPKAVSVPTKGAWTDHTFTSAGSETFHWSITGSTLTRGRLQFLTPDGSSAGVFDFGTGTSQDDFGVFAETPGTYRIRVSAAYGETGTATLTLRR